MLITLFTDAGYCPIIRRGSFAAWAKADGGTMREHGVLQGELETAGVAEARAVVNGLFLATRKFRPEPSSRVIVASDCEEAMKALTNALTPKAMKRHADAVAHFQRICDRHQLSVSFRHVKGHSVLTDTRRWVNRWCDKACTRALKEIRRENLAEYNLRKGEHDHGA